MKKDDISPLLQRYLSNHLEGKEAYFDANEIDDLLDSFEESDDYTYYDEVLALGLRLHPGNPDLLIRQCKLLVYNEEYEKALALIERIAETDNEDLDILKLECYCSLNQYNKIIEFTEELIANNCEYLETIFEYIVPILSDLEMYKEARDYIDRGLILFPTNMVLKDELCYNLEIEGDLEKAIEICNALIDQNPYSYDYWFSLGRLYSMTAEYDKAIEAFDFALTCDDSNAELKILKAYCLYMNENYEKAIEVYKDLGTSIPEADERIQPLLAQCFMKLEEYEQAYVLLKKQIEEDVLINEPSNYINYIRCCIETDRQEEASNMLIKAAERYPDNIRILSLLALTYLESGNDQLAVETTDRLFNALDKTDDNQPEDFESLFHAAQYLYSKGEIDRALKYYKKILETNPQMPYMHLHMAMAYLAKGDTKQFKEHYSKSTPEELAEYLKSSGQAIYDNQDKLAMKHIPPKDLVKEFLKNKDNKN